MSRSAMPAMRKEATQRFKPPKVTSFAELTFQARPYGPHADGCERLETVANGCERMRNVERTHPQPPDSQSETGTLATLSGKTKSQKKQEYVFLFPSRSDIFLRKKGFAEKTSILAPRKIQVCAYIYNIIIYIYYHI